MRKRLKAYARIGQSRIGFQPFGYCLCRADARMRKKREGNILTLRRKHCVFPPKNDLAFALTSSYCAAALPLPSSAANSPDWNISRVMSQPPMNSLLT